MSVLLQWSSSMITCSAERPLPILTSIIKKPLHRAPKFQGISLQKYLLEVRYESGNGMFLVSLSRTYLPSRIQVESECETINVTNRFSVKRRRMSLLKSRRYSARPDDNHRFSTWETKCPFKFSSPEILKRVGLWFLATVSPESCKRGWKYSVSDVSDAFRALLNHTCSGNSNQPILASSQ